MVILLVDDEPGITKLYARILGDYEVRTFNNPIDALEFAKENHFDILIADQRMPELTGLDLVAQLSSDKQNQGEIDFIAIVISAFTDTDDLIDAVNSQAIYQYLVKPIHPNQLRQAVFHAQEVLEKRKERYHLQRELEEQNRRLQKENRLLRTRSSSLESFVGFHPDTVHLKERVKMFAHSENPVLVIGETGTGKELIARALHELSPRREKSFITVNCSAFSPQLLESELFGHVKGAYTGAVTAKKGILETADGGTLFLDEIGDFPIEFQSKILRFIQFGTFIPVGGVKERRVEVRLISATNRNLSEAVEKEKFRRDLYYRLNTLTLTIQPLRARPQDIIPIMEEIAIREGYTLPEFEEGVRETLMQYSFYGNVRELEAFVEKMMLQDRQWPIEKVSTRIVRELLIEDGYVYHEHPPSESNTRLIDAKVFSKESIDLPTTIAEIEQRIIEQHLKLKNYNITKTAESLNLSRQGLKNKMKRYRIYVH